MAEPSRAKSISCPVEYPVDYGRSFSITNVVLPVQGCDRTTAESFGLACIVLGSVDKKIMSVLEKEHQQPYQCPNGNEKVFLYDVRGSDLRPGERDDVVGWQMFLHPDAAATSPSNEQEAKKRKPYFKLFCEEGEVDLRFRAPPEHDAAGTTGGRTMQVSNTTLAFLQNSDNVFSSPIGDAKRATWLGRDKARLGRDGWRGMVVEKIFYTDLAAREVVKDTAVCKTVPRVVKEKKETIELFRKHIVENRDLVDFCTAAGPRAFPELWDDAREARNLDADQLRHIASFLGESLGGNRWLMKLEELRGADDHSAVEVLKRKCEYITSFQVRAYKTVEELKRNQPGLLLPRADFIDADLYYDAEVYWTNGIKVLEVSSRLLSR